MSKDAINLTKRFKEDLALIQAELNKESNSYLMSYCLYIGTVDENGELHHITGHFSRSTYSSLLHSFQYILCKYL